MPDKKKERPFSLLGKTAQQLLKYYYNHDLSDAFLACADAQLTSLFEELVKPTVRDHTIYLGWEPGNSNFHYSPGIISRLTAVLRLKYGAIPVTICWQSDSGHIYRLSDQTIPCDKLRFWLEGLDIERAAFLQKPVWSLFTFPETIIERFHRLTPGVALSAAFLRCADRQLTPQFERLVGFKAGRQVSLDISDAPRFSWLKGPTSRLSATLYINHHWNHNISICWKTHSGKIYDIGEVAIDENDIEFWLEGLDPVLHHRQMYPGHTLPFKLKALSYHLTILSTGIEIVIHLQLKPAVSQEQDEIAARIDGFIDDYNTVSLQAKRKHGLIHQYAKEVLAGQLVYEIDTGFTGASFLKPFLEFLSGLEAFTSVEIS